MEITDYDRWKFRKCLETLDRYGCANIDTRSESDICKKCRYYIEDKKWGHLLIRLMCDSNQTE